MIFEEALQEMIAGKKVTHMYFSDDEWMTKGKNGKFIFEDGVEYTLEEFWQYRKGEVWKNNWSLFEETLTINQ